MKYASEHASERFIEYLGAKLLGREWKMVVIGAKRGFYQMASARLLGKRKTAVYVVPVFSWGIFIMVPMVVDVTRGYVITVLPPDETREPIYQYR